MSGAFHLWRGLEKLERALFAVATVGSVAALLTMPHWTVDDAYIVQRYAANWVHHGELTWNLGEPPIEGYTGIVLPCIYALAELVGMAGPTLSAIVGAMSLLGTAAALAAAVRELNAPPPSRGITYALYLATAEQYTHAVSGLETSLFALAVSLMVWAFLRALRDPRADWKVVLVAAFVGLVRPEGVGISCVAIAVLGWERWRAGNLGRFASRVLLGFAVPVGGHLLFRLAYYHAWLPNTYFAKLEAGGNVVYFRRWWQLLERTALPALALAPLVAVVGWVTRRAVWKPTPRLPSAALMIAGSLLVLCLAYARSNLVMDYSHRFEIHSQPFVILAAGWVAGAGVRAMWALACLGRSVALTTVLIAALLFAAPFRFGWEQLAREREFAAGYARTLDAENRAAATWISAELAPDATLAVYPDAGILGLRTALRTIDFGRLNDAYLAREARSDADVVAYFFARRPDALATICFPAPDPDWPSGAQAILADPRMSDYQLVHRYAHPFASVPPALCLYVRRSRLGAP